MIRRINTLLLFHVGMLWAAQMHGQQASIPLQRWWTIESERIALMNDSTPTHLAEKPFLAKKTIGGEELIWLEPSRNFSKVGAKIFRDHLIDVRKDDYRIVVDPLFDITGGRDVADTSAFHSDNLMFNQRGIQLSGDIGKKFSFQTSFFETQALTPDYLRRLHDASGVYPSYGRTKAFGERGYDFAMATSLLTYAPTKNITLQMGQGQQFYGHGYRSLLWSDASFVHPFAKAGFEFLGGKLRYSTMYAELRTLERLPKGEVPESLFKPKSASVNYLSFAPSKHLEIGLFESTIWNRFDSTGTHPPSLWASLPIIGLHSAAEGLDAQNNSMVGVNIRVTPGRKIKLYGQVAIDDWASRRIGLQAGLQLYDLLAKGLSVQLEYNRTGEYMYASPYALQSYSHANQPLGHPAGGALSEQLAIFNYHKKRLLLEVRAQHLSQSTGPMADYTTNPDVEMQTFIAWATRQLYSATAEVGWIIQPQTCTSFSAGITWRSENTQLVVAPLFDTETRYIWLGLKSHIFNSYSDF